MKTQRQKNFVIAALALCLVSAAPAFASADVMTRIRQNYGGTRPVSATFELSIYWDVRERTETRAGELHIAAGDRFRVTLGRDVFVSDGATFWQYSERNSQVVIRRFTDIDPATLPTGMLATFLSGREFEISPRDERGQEIELVWRGDDGEYREIVVHYNVGTGVIRMLRLKDRHNNIHAYTFTQTTFDRPPRDNTFRFNAPRGTSVVDMREQ